MRGLSGLSYLIKDYAETRNGKISTFPQRALFSFRATKRDKPIEYRWSRGFVQDSYNWLYTHYKGRGVKCCHRDKWIGLFPFHGHSKSNGRPWFHVDMKACKSCEFHEPAERRKRYASCRWFRENSGMDSPVNMFVKSMDRAVEFLK